MSDKAHFEMSKFVNKRNMRFWNEGGLYKLHLKQQHNQTATLGYGAGCKLSMSPTFSDIKLAFRLLCHLTNVRVVTVLTLRVTPY